MQISEQSYLEVVQFLYKEAELQDQKRNREWLDLWTADSTYYMPVRVTKEKEVSGILPRSKGGFIVDDKEMLELRVRREETDFAWAENPPSRTKHFITNVIVNPGEKENEIKVKSYVLLTVHRSDDLTSDFFPYERQDVLRHQDGRWKIASRTVIPEQSRLTIDRISFWL